MGQHDPAVAELERLIGDAERGEAAAAAAEHQAQAKADAATAPAVTLPGELDDRARAAAEKALAIVEMVLRMWCPTVQLPKELYGEAGEQVGPFIQDRGWHERGLLKVGPYDNAIKAGMFVGAVVVEVVRQVGAAKEKTDPVGAGIAAMEVGAGGEHREYTTS